MNKTEITQYCREVRSYLPCSFREKRRIIRQIQDNISLYLQDHPDADMQQIRAHFGTPNQIAAACVEDMETAVLLRSLRTRKKIVTAIAAGVLSIVILSLSYIGFRIDRFMDSIEGTCTIILYPEQNAYAVEYITIEGE